MNVTITIKIGYDRASVADLEDLAQALHREVDRCIEDGMLTPSGEEVVDDCGVDVEVEDE